MKENIKSLRIKIGLTQAQLAELMGVDQTAVAKWESGVSMPSADKLPLLASSLHCTIDELFYSPKTNEETRSA